MERHLSQIDSVSTKWMEIAMPGSRPVDELDPEFEARLGGPHEVGFVESDQLIEPMYRRDCRFADTDNADRIGLEQVDRNMTPERLGQRRGRHPACRPAAENDDALHPICHHPAIHACPYEHAMLCRPRQYPLGSKWPIKAGSRSLHC